MNIVFFASGKFALKSLNAVHATKNKIRLVITAPDRPKGRRLNSFPTAIAVLAESLGLSLHKTTDPNSEETINIIREARADLFVVVSYGCILSLRLLNLAGLYALNIHASLLPKYRGASPINWAILNGEKQTGISIIKMEKTMDTGDILLQKETAITAEDDAESLSVRLEELSAEALKKSLELIRLNKASFISQVNSKASYAPKLTKNLGIINWNKPAKDIVNQIKALIPWPGAFSSYNGKLLKIWKASFRENPRASPGEISRVNRDAIVVGCGQGELVITELQMENGKRLSARDFICGHKLKAGAVIGAPLT